MDTEKTIKNTNESKVAYDIGSMPAERIVHLCDIARKHFQHAVVHPPAQHVKHDDSSSRDVVRWFMSALSPKQVAPPPALSNDLATLRRAVISILSLADEKILTPEEADAVIRFVAERFTSRRLDEVVSRVTSPRHGAWFALRHPGSEK